METPVDRLLRVSERERDGLPEQEKKRKQKRVEPFVGPSLHGSIEADSLSMKNKTVQMSGGGGLEKDVRLVYFTYDRMNNL